MKYWRYITYAVLFTEILVFGHREPQTWAILGLVVVLAVVHLLVGFRPFVQLAKLEIQKNNPLPRPIFIGVSLLFSSIAMVLPYFSGELNLVLTLLALTLVSISSDK